MRGNTSLRALLVLSVFSAVIIMTVGPATWAAVPVEVVNAGFEDPIYGEYGWGTFIPGWDYYNGGDIGVWNPRTLDYPAEAPEGSNVAWVGNAGADTGTTQVLSGATGLFERDAVYTMTVQVGYANGYSNAGYQVQLLAGGTVLDQDDNSLTLSQGVFATSNISYTYNADQSALVGEPLAIRLLTKGLNGGENNFDDVVINATYAHPISYSESYALVDTGSLSLDGSGSLPSDGSSISQYDWDLDNDGLWDITGETPAAISYADLTTTYGMVPGANTIGLRVTDGTTAEQAISSTRVTLASTTSVDATWDTAPGTVGAGDSSITGGDGTWDTTNGNWTTDSGASNVAWINSNNDTAIFGGAGGTVTLGEPITVGGLQFDTAGYTITGNTLTFGAAGAIAANADATIDSLIAGSVAVTKTGPGKLTLTGANTYTGLTTISSGELILQGAAFATASRDYRIASGAVLNLDNPDNVPEGNTTIDGTGTLRFNGGFWCQGGGRYVDIALGSGGVIDVASGSDVYNGGWWTMTWTDNLADLNVDGRFNIWDGHDVFIDALTGDGMVLRGHIKTGPDSPVTILTVGVDNGSGTFSGSINVSQYNLPLDIIKTGSGTQILTGSNTYKGELLVSDGTLVLGGAGALTYTDSGITVNGPTAVFMQNSSVANGRQFTLTMGTLGGTGTITTAITSGPDVIIAPGDRTLATPQPGILTIENAVDLTDGTTEMRIFNATLRDILMQTTTGELTYGGILEIVNVNSLEFAVGDQWDLFDFESQSGTFSNDDEFGSLGGTFLPLLTGGQAWSFDYSTGVLSVVGGNSPGDTNGDGVTDSADYMTVKRNMGLATGAGATDGDFDLDGTVDWDDLQTLMSGFNTTAGGGTIPEPATLFVMLGAGLPALLRRRRSRS